MNIADSTHAARDHFRWSVHNTNSARLFTLDFDNQSLQISYGLDDSAALIRTGVEFGNDDVFEVVISMNFARNLWSASVADIPVVTSAPITTTNAPLNFAGVSAE
ncbi:MAG: hypothetical protein HY735_23560 [Verrucomicrobia bacterium]|nr:hypothetical protein [Verrucomicrobiota bacterium]